MFHYSQPQVVDANVIRGGRPINKEAVQQLKKMGVKTVICLFRSGLRYPEEISGSIAEKRIVENCGMRFVHIPLDESRAPSPEDIKRFLEFAQQGSNYVHCSRGVDRAGLMVAIYELEVHDKTYDEVYTNYLKNGHDCFTWPNLDAFLYEYAKKKLGDHIDPSTAIIASLKRRNERNWLYDRIMR